MSIQSVPGPIDRAAKRAFSTPGGGGWPFPAGHLPSPDLFGMDEAAARIRTALRGTLNVPRRARLERRLWQDGARHLMIHGGPSSPQTATGYFATRRPYLVVHPEREIAEADYFDYVHCDACVETTAYADRLEDAIAAAHAHNAAMHPRRHARSQQPRVDTRIVASDPRLDAESAAQAAASNPWSVKP